MTTTLESGNEEVNVITSQEEKSTIQYITVGFLTRCPKAPPPSDVLVQYTVIGGRSMLTTVRIWILASYIEMHKLLHVVAMFIA